MLARLRQVNDPSMKRESDFKNCVENGNPSA